MSKLKMFMKRCSFTVWNLQNFLINVLLILWEYEKKTTPREKLLSSNNILLKRLVIFCLLGINFFLIIPKSNSILNYSVSFTRFSYELQNFHYTQRFISVIDKWWLKKNQKIIFIGKFLIFVIQIHRFKYCIEIYF